MRTPWPRSLLGRNLLLLVFVVVACEVSTFAIFFQFIEKPRIDEAASLVASQTRLVEQLLNALPLDQRRKELEALKGSEAEFPDSAYVDDSPSNFLARRFLETLALRLPPGTQIRWERRSGHQIWVQLRVESKLGWVMLPVSSAITHLSWSVIAQLLTLAAFPALGAWLIQRHTAGRLQRLARAAATMESGAWPEPVPVDGPLELATVADTFNRMVTSLAEMDATRAEMLAGISHDIRTPLTKLRMAIAAPESFDAPSASAERFVAEIDAIVEQFIDFARGWDSEPSAPGDLTELVRQLAADYVGLGYTFKLSLTPLPAVMFRPIGIQRLLMNLMHNAVTYGQVGLAVQSWVETGYVALSIEDAGPGVPEAQLPILKRPFIRGPQSNQPPGTGLGLAIAERIARQHGGRLDLSLRAGGGLAVALRLPCP